MAKVQGEMTSRLVTRVRAVLLRPRDEWRLIDGERSDALTLYRGYIAPLAAIAPIAGLVGAALIGVSVPFVGAFRVSIGTALAQAVVAYALALAATYVLALVIDTLAPTFAGSRSMTQALKVAAYSSTAQWLAGVFALVPTLSPLRVLGLYSLYLLYLGLPVLMKVPSERAVSYTAAVVVVGVVLAVLVGAAAGAAVGSYSYY